MTTTVTPRQARREQRRMEHYAMQRATAPDPKARTRVAFSRLRALCPPHDPMWQRIDATLTEFINEKEMRP